MTLAAAALLVLASAGVGVLGSDGTAPTEAETAEVGALLGLEPDAVRPIGVGVTADPWFTVGATLQPCTRPRARDLAAALTRAQEMLKDLDGPGAVRTLSAATESSSCAATWIDADAFRRALEWTGHAAQVEGDDALAEDAYAQLAAADSDWHIEPPLGSGFEVLWDRVREDLLASSLASVVVHGGDREVRWDGVAVPAPTARLAVIPGRHLLQWAGADEAIRGAWVLVVPGTAAVAFVSADRADVAALLTEGTASEAGRAALQVWLGALRTAHGLDELVVVRDPTPRTGYRVDGHDLTAWSEDLRTDFTMAADRARILFGGGYLSTRAAYHYVDVRVGAEVKLIGPLHVHVDLSVATTTLTHPDPAWDGTAVLLPGLGAGIAFRKPLGIAQPFAMVTGGLWILGDQSAFDATLRDQTLDEGSRIDAADGPVAPRLFVDGGIDIVPAGRAIVVRVSGGAGYGLGFQVRAAVLVGLRFGK